MRAILGCGLAVVLVLAATAGAEDKAEKIDGKLLVGKWEPTEAPKGAKVLIEFTKDGKVSYAVSGEGKEFKLDGTYKVEGNKVLVTMKVGDKETTKTRTVSKLTETEMVSKDDKGKEDTLKKIK